MAEPQIELRKIRDFGANLSDTFEFIRDHFKSLLTSFLAIAGIFMLLMSVMTGIFESKLMVNFRVLRTGAPGLSGIHDTPFFHPMSFLLYFLGIWVGYTAMHVAAGAYMKFCDEHPGMRPRTEEVWQIFRRYFLRVLLYMIPVALLIAVGALLCLAPGIYLGVVLVPFGWVVMLEEADFGTALSRCFDLIRGYFWISLALYLVTSIIYSFASSMIGLLVAAVSGLLAFFTVRDVSFAVGVASAVIRLFGFVFYLIFLVSALLHYYNLVERRDGVGMKRRIAEIGEAPEPDDSFSPEY